MARRADPVHPGGLPGIGRVAASLIYEGTDGDSDELRLITEVDRAHLVMLAERGLVPAERAGRLLSCIAALRAEDFRPLRARPAPRGLYLMYESYLIERLGIGTGGLLHTARSRNDLKATTTSLRVRAWLRDFLAEGGRLEGGLLVRSRAHQSVVMPVYTHFQAAMPISYGYYLLGVALAVGRDLDALEFAARGLDTCPLGAGAVAGTDLPIDAERTARLLGFARAPLHALDAIASRDAIVHLAAGLTQLSITLSRLATDLQLWSTAEFGMITFPDRLVGGSSAMPQKRNAFLLEHVRAKAGHALGALTAALATMKSAPFTNSIEVGTEAVAAAWPAFTAARAAVMLCQLLVSGAKPVPERMLGRATAGFTTATLLANRLVREGVAFRQAHEMVGEAVREAAREGADDAAAFLPAGHALTSTHPADAAAAAAFGGGPGSFAIAYDAAVAAWQARGQRLSRARTAHQAAVASLDDAVAALATPAGRQP